MRVCVLLNTPVNFVLDLFITTTDGTATEGKEDTDFIASIRYRVTVSYKAYRSMWENDGRHQNMPIKLYHMLNVTYSYR